MLFISPKKLFLFLRYLSFCLDFLFMYQNSLIKKIRLTSNFLTSQPREQTIVIYILPNISRSKGNQTMKFGQLIECNIRNIFLEKSYIHKSLDQYSKVLYSLFLFYPRLRAKYIETKLQTTCFYFILSINKKRFGTSLPVSFSA